MNATEEWLRYIENDAIKRRYGITKYDSEEEKEDDENTKESEEV